MKSIKPHLSSRLFATSLLFSGAVWAAPITLTNPGFEDPVVATDGGTGPVPTAWTVFNSGAVITLNPSSSGDLTAEAPEGANVALVTSNAAENGLSQVLTSPFQADSPYALTAKVANTKFTSGFPGYRVQLVANGTVLAEDDNSQVIAEDSVVTATVNYSYNAGLHAGLVGQPLEIRLLSKGLATGEEVAFDDVQLSVTLLNPVADPGGPYTVAIPGGSLTLDGSGSLPADGQAITSWDWDLDNDGDFDEAITGATPAAIDYATLTAAPPTGFGMIAGANTIKLRVTDNSLPTPKTSTAEATVTLAEPTTTLSTGNWQGGAWSNGQPTGAGLNAIIAGNVNALGNVTAWSGNLTVNSGVTLTVNGTAPPTFIAIEGAPNIYLSGTIVNNWKSRTVSSNFILSGGGRLSSTTNDANNQDQVFSGVFSGTGGFKVSGRNHQGMKFTNVNDFTGGFTAESQNQRYAIGFGTGSAGAGDVTTNGTVGQQGPVIEVRADNPFASTATLSLNGSGFNNSTGGFGPYTKYLGTNFLIDINGRTATVDKVFVNGVQQAAGSYSGGSASWIGDKAVGAGGTLIVTTGPIDNTPPTLAGSGFVDNKSGGPITAFETVTYTVTFSEPMKGATVETGDFENATSPAATINSVTPTLNPAVFTVSVTPGGTGTLQLQVKAGAVLEDIAGNPLDTTTAIADDTVITVNPDPLPSLVSITDNKAGGPVFENEAFTYYVTFDQLMDPATVDAADFENGSGPAVTVTNVIAAGTPSVFAVDVTPGGTGTITLQIKSGATIENANGTALNTTTALPDDIPITVNAGSTPPRGTITFDGPAEFTSANSGTLTRTFDASGSDKLVVIVTGENGNPGDLNGNSTSVTYDGTPLTKVVDRNPIGGTPYDQTFNDIWYLDMDGVTTVTGAISATVNSRGSITVFGLSGTAPGVGQTAISPQASKSVVLSTSFANSIVIASHGMGGDGNSANVTAVDAVLPLIETSATAQASGAPFPWDGHVTAYALASSAGSAAYEFTGGNLVGSHTIAAEFLAAEAGAGDTFADWIGTFPGVGGLDGVGDDADGDGIDNGVENFFGTNPSAFSSGLVAGAVGVNTFTFTHPQNATPASDLTAAYQWSKDLATFNAGGVTDGDNTKVDFTTLLDTPVAGTTTVTATVSGTATSKLFVNIKVTQP